MLRCTPSCQLPDVYFRPRRAPLHIGLQGYYCKHPEGCILRASYGPLGLGKPKFCKGHRGPTDVQFAKFRCKFPEGCFKQATFKNLLDYSFYCKKHRGQNYTAIWKRGSRIKHPLSTARASPGSRTRTVIGPTTGPAVSAAPADVDSTMTEYDPEALSETSVAKSEVRRICQTDDTKADDSRRASLPQNGVLGVTEPGTLHCPRTAQAVECKKFDAESKVINGQTVESSKKKNW